MANVVEEVFIVFKNKYKSELADVPEPGRSVIAAVSIKGVIDNGGMQYFLERDWPGFPPHADLARVFTVIGCPQVALLIETACALSGDLRGLAFEKRLAKMATVDEKLDQLSTEFYKWGQAIEASIVANAAEFLGTIHNQDDA